jgi:hypothetical protein
MTAPAFLSSTYRFLKFAGVTDVQTILDNIAIELVASGWTDNGGGSYTSPVDAVGRFHTDVFTRVDADTLEMATTDQDGTALLSRRMEISAVAGTTSTVSLFTGQYHFHVEALWPTQVVEHLCSGILDLSPEAQNAHTKYVYNAGWLTNAGGSAGPRTIVALCMIDNATPTQTVRCIDYTNIGGGGGVKYKQSGGIIFHPKEVFSTTATVSFAFCGRCYQHICVPDIFSPGSLIKIPVDGSTLGSFVVSGVPVSVYGGFLQAIRVA